MAKCPVCGKPSAARAVNEAFPFCSERCRLVDLGKWLGEEYRVPVHSPDEEEDGGQPRGDQDDRRGEGDGHHDT
ncbi:MAG TPA: DNA gyrase inhibitor YacG [Myxococcales bacterium]|nr:DNA gyrase inhibitor YacG [Myxococcales bacterium]